MALFGKKITSPEEEKRSVPPLPPPAAPRPEAGEKRSEGRNAVIGPHVRIQGELSAEEDLVIEGRVEGKVTSTKTVRVGPSAQVNAEVKAQNVVVAGRVVGNVVASDRIEILASGSLEGNIRSPKIAIAEGAQFKGSVDMGTKGQPQAPSGKEAAPAAGGAPPSK